MLNKEEKQNIIKKDKNYTKKIFNILICIIFIFLILIILDKFTINYLNTYISKQIDKKLIEKYPDSLIITTYVNKDQIAHIPIITYDNIKIDWGDGTIDKYISYKLNNQNNIEDNVKYNIYNDIITPIHKYKKKGKYNIIITGDTKRGMFGLSNFTTIDKFGQDMFKKEFLNNIPIYQKNNKNSESKEILDLQNSTINKYISLHNEKKENNSNKTQIYNIIFLKNLNFKGLGNLTPFFSGEIDNTWLTEIYNIEIFIETFEFSDITYIPENIFLKCPNLRILSSTFLSCNKLKSIPDNLIHNLENIENIRYCFSNCKNLEGNAPLWWENMTKIKDIKNVEKLPYLLCFNECHNLNNYKNIPFLWGGIIENKNNKERIKE